MYVYFPSDHSLPRLSHVGPRSRRVSDLQDIPELDEDVSSSSTMTESSGIPPPVDLELERQFVEDGMYRSALTVCTHVHVHVHIHVNKSKQGKANGSTQGRQLISNKLPCRYMYMYLQGIHTCTCKSHYKPCRNHNMCIQVHVYTFIG